MTGAQVLAGIVTITTISSYLNDQYFKLPKSIGLTLITFMIASTLMFSCSFGLGVCEKMSTLQNSVHFNETFLDIMLGFLLFAAALNIHYKELIKQKWMILMFATLSVVLSTFIVGGLLFGVVSALGINLSFMYCLLFGALISPTDPVAVMGVLKTVRVSKDLEMYICGEALFNDAMGLVLFVLILKITTGTAGIDTPIEVLWYLIQQGLGGIVYGLILGGLVAFLMRKTDSFDVSLLLTLFVVTAGYTFASTVLEVSGIIAMASAGLIIGPFFRLQMTEMRARLMGFWEVIDEVLNAFLFVLIGLECLTLQIGSPILELGGFSIFIVILARFISVALPIYWYGLFKRVPKNLSMIMTWGGLRGGVSIALALSLPMRPERDIIIAITYAVVIFSILVQGLTIKRVVQRLVTDRE